MSRPLADTSALVDGVRGCLAVARLTILEATRQRLWWLVVVVMIGLLVIIPNLQAVDAPARLKLAVATISGTIGFICTMLSVFIVTVSVRRDLESRSSFMLFSKPLPRWSYCLGRWLGALLALAVVVGLLSLAGVAAIRMQLGATPAPQALRQAAQWQVVDSLGQATDLRADQQRVTLDQRPGSGLRVRFDGLASGARDGHSQRLLIKAMIRGRDGFSVHSTTPVQVSLLFTAADGSVSSRLLPVAPEQRAIHGDDGSQVLLRHRALQRRDLDNDYVHFVISPDLIAADGSITVQVLRLDREAVITVPREGGIIMTTRGKPFVIDVLLAGVVHLAHAGVLAAVALALVVVSGVGTSLLGCLTLFFGGHAIGVVAAVGASSQTSLTMRRMIDLVVPLVPDFSRYPVAAQLAAAETVPLRTVLAAWSYFGVWMLCFMALAWLMLRRKEL